MNRQTVHKKIDAFDGREIVISDIHGDLDSFLMLLEKTGYQPDKDRLILLGDLVEKGTQNLALLQYVMELKEKGNVEILMGNCDFVAKNFLFSYRLDFIQKELLKRKNSLIHEMIAQSHLEPLDEYTDMDQLAFELRKRYLKELTFLNDLVQVIETPERIYVHAGLIDENSFAGDFRNVLTYPLFGETSKSFTKTVVVGHMPVSEYCRTIGDFNPRYHAKSNIYSIDGGNMVKKGGQLNALIFNKSVCESVSVSRAPKAKAITVTYPHNPSPFFVGWNHGDIEIREKGERQSLVYSDWLKRTFWIDNSFIKTFGDRAKGTDYTNYEMPLNYGDIVEIVSTYGNKTQIKKQGRLGWTLSENLELL